MPNCGAATSRWFYLRARTRPTKRSGCPSCAASPDRTGTTLRPRVFFFDSPLILTRREVAGWSRYRDSPFCLAESLGGGAAHRRVGANAPLLLEAITGKRDFAIVRCTGRDASSARSRLDNRERCRSRRPRSGSGGSGRSLPPCLVAPPRCGAHRPARTLPAARERGRSATARRTRRGPRSLRSESRCRAPCQISPPRRCAARRPHRLPLARRARLAVPSTAKTPSSAATRRRVSFERSALRRRNPEKVHDAFHFCACPPARPPNLRPDPNSSLVRRDSTWEHAPIGSSDATGDSAHVQPSHPPTSARRHPLWWAGRLYERLEFERR